MNTYRIAKKDVKKSIEQLKCACSSHKAIMKLQKTCTSPLLCYFPIHFEAWQLQFPVITWKSDQHNSLKLLHLLLLHERKRSVPKRFGTTWRWANDIIFFFGWTIHLHICVCSSCNKNNLICICSWRSTIHNSVIVSHISVCLCSTVYMLYRWSFTQLYVYAMTPTDDRERARERERQRERERARSPGMCTCIEVWIRSNGFPSSSLFSLSHSAVSSSFSFQWEGKPC